CHKALINVYADALNYDLHTHPKVTPRVIKRFEPWMALTFSEGSIGVDIVRVNLTQLEAFYGKGPKKESSQASASAPLALPPLLKLPPSQTLRRTAVALAEAGRRDEPGYGITGTPKGAPYAEPTAAPYAEHTAA